MHRTHRKKKKWGENTGDWRRWRWGLRRARRWDTARGRGAVRVDREMSATPAGGRYAERAPLASRSRATWRVPLLRVHWVWEASPGGQRWSAQRAFLRWPSVCSTSAAWMSGGAGALARRCRPNAQRDPNASLFLRVGALKRGRRGRRILRADFQICRYVWRKRVRY